MPRGTQHKLTGLLRPGKPGPVLHIDGGGEWRLDCAQRYEHLLGKRVLVEGTRSGFDLLSVNRIWQRGTPEPAARPGILAAIRQRLGS